MSDDPCIDDDHVWQVVDETPDGVVVECYDCGAEYEGELEETR